ncbi:MAG: hypothetical protein IH594_10525 [Bacteroidales bacterium]|nr:hypothetical protein [Bacteroidales bacterium]
MFDDYSKGTVFLESGAVYPDLLLKYYGVNDELVYFNKINNSAISIDREILDKFIILHPETGEEMLFKKVPGYSGIFTDPSPLFAQVLHEGQLKLYVFRMNRVDGVKSEKRGNNTYYQDFYALKSRYVLIKPGFRPVYFTKINHKQLLRLFPEKAGEIKQLQKQDKLKRRIRSVQELIRLMELMEDTGGGE